MSVLAERVCRTIHRHDLLPPGSRVIVAGSGGADSTALVCLLKELSPRLGVDLVGLAHFNHRLRGAAADQDEASAATLAARLSLPFFCESDDVSSAARRMGTSVEDAGRRLRYAFLERTADAAAAGRIAVGHTRDDQAETLLLHLVRGAGLRGIGAMRPRRGRIVRPLLDCTHRELVAWLTGRGIPFREDESNLDVRFLRNRVRHEVLPALGLVAPSIVDQLARMARIAQDDNDCLDAVAADVLGRASRLDGDRLVLDASALAAEPPAVARRVALLALARVAAGRYQGFDQADRVLALVARRAAGHAARFPGVQARLDGPSIVFEAASGRNRPAGEPIVGLARNSFRAPLSIPGEVLFEDGSALSSELRQSVETGSGESLLAALRRNDRNTAVVDAKRASTLAVRFRQPGDWFRPLGLGGRKKLQDFFVDRKVPRAERNRVPLVVDGDDRIVWVAGHGIAEDFRVSEGTRGVVILKLRGERA